MSGGDIYSRAVARIGVTTLIIGAAAAAYMLFTRGWRAALALAIGAALAWINFRWLKGGVAAISASIPAASAPDVAPAPPPRSRAAAFAKFIGRFALLAGIVYVILSRSLLPAIPMLAGLFASAAAAVVQMIFLLFAAPGVSRN
ncbi:MAG TPA: ATP synthase subunit I [Candidatus Acidoferrales bacterium]|nr:ATP synthase subunit I [Candidatus Acidoferrales bacterium]